MKRYTAIDSWKWVGANKVWATTYGIDLKTDEIPYAGPKLLLEKGLVLSDCYFICSGC